MNDEFDVIVIGGGVIGLAAALAMVQQGFSVALLDSGPLISNLLTPDARVYAINLASQDLLHTLGIWQQLDKNRISPYRHMHVWDAASRADMHFDATMVAAPELGVIVEESVLKQALLQQLNKHLGLTLFAHATVSALTPADDHIKVSTANQHWQAKLLMVADGSNSPCRQLLKVALTRWSYHQHALVALVNTERSHQQTAYQVFNPDGPLAFLPLADAKQCSIVWSTTPARAKQLMALDDENFNKQLGTAFANKLGSVRIQGLRHQFPLTMRHAKQYSGTSWLLLGDAAHTIHPLAGLGLNVGFADLSTWLSCLKASSNVLLSKKALSSYQRQRKYAVWKIIALMDGLKTLFTNPLPPFIALRSLGLRACNNMTFLKRMFIEQAAGKKLDSLGKATKSATKL